MFYRNSLCFRKTQCILFLYLNLIINYFSVINALFLKYIRSAFFSLLFWKYIFFCAFLTFHNNCEMPLKELGSHMHVVKNTLVWCSIKYLNYIYLSLFLIYWHLPLNVDCLLVLRYRFYVICLFNFYFREGHWIFEKVYML